MAVDPALKGFKPLNNGEPPKDTETTLGAIVGDVVGNLDGLSDGLVVGLLVGLTVGVPVGDPVGPAVGPTVGDRHTRCAAAGATRWPGGVPHDGVF